MRVPPLYCSGTLPKPEWADATIAAEHNATARQTRSGKQTKRPAERIQLDHTQSSDTPDPRRHVRAGIRTRNARLRLWARGRREMRQCGKRFRGHSAIHSVTKKESISPHCSQRKQLTAIFGKCRSARRNASKQKCGKEQKMPLLPQPPTMSRPLFSRRAGKRNADHLPGMKFAGPTTPIGKPQMRYFLAAGHRCIAYSARRLYGRRTCRPSADVYTYKHFYTDAARGARFI